MSVKWYEKKEGEISSIRIMAMMSVATGNLAVVSGIVAMFLRISDGVLMAGIGAGMTGVGEIMKAWQAKTEG